LFFASKSKKQTTMASQKKQQTDSSRAFYWKTKNWANYINMVQEQDDKLENLQQTGRATLKNTHNLFYEKIRIVNEMFYFIAHYFGDLSNRDDPWRKIWEEKCFQIISKLATEMTLQNNLPKTQQERELIISLATSTSEMMKAIEDSEYKNTSERPKRNVKPVNYNEDDEDEDEDDQDEERKRDPDYEPEDEDEYDEDEYDEDEYDEDEYQDEEIEY